MLPDKEIKKIGVKSKPEKRLPKITFEIKTINADEKSILIKINKIKMFASPILRNGIGFGTNDSKIKKRTEITENADKTKILFLIL